MSDVPLYRGRDRDLGARRGSSSRRPTQRRKHKPDYGLGKSHFQYESLHELFAPRSTAAV